METVNLELFGQDPKVQKCRINGKKRIGHKSAGFNFG